MTSLAVWTLNVMRTVLDDFGPLGITRHVVPGRLSPSLATEIVVPRDVSIWRTELRRGLVELCVLAVLYDREAYGYQIVADLRRRANLEFTESTVYPVLARLHREKLLDQRKESSSTGPPRRYFRLTKTGLRRYRDMVQQWQKLSDQVKQLIHKEIDDDDAD